MPREPRRNDPFNLSDAERSEIAGRALGGHIWDSMENMLGGAGSFRQGVVTNAWADAHANWQGHDIRADADDDDYPYVHLEHPKAPGVHGRYPIGGSYLDIHVPGRDYAVEALHIDQSNRSNPDEIKRQFHSWVKEDYPTRDPRDW